MTVVAAYLYRHGKRVREISIHEKVDCPSDRSEFVWIGICDPTHEEMQVLKEQYNLHPLAVEDAVDARQLPKVDVYGNQLFVVAKTAALDGDRIEYGETAIFLGHSHIISVRHGSARSHTALRQHLEAAPTLLIHGVDYVLHAILDFIVDGYLPIVEAIEDNVLTMEQRSLDTFLGRDEITRIFTLRRQLAKFQRVLAPMAEVAGKLVRLDLPCIDPETRPYFSDVLDHVRRVQTLVDGLIQIVISVFEFSNLLEQQRTGAITRQLAAWAAILAVPTAIAGIYGMNFEYMPELKSHYGYFIVLGVIVAACTLLYVRFRQARWL
ncbi:magnesium and cobalt transport protein CorA [Aureimonas phyllosphaerae]|uniref:Magnesium transporter n=1 Tax=Aureimonas phyllosphaerae TaxID=1166078 RepID=A0A7W6FTV4_9HYPH|nr:magnesium and cobalt transport protein CorA [Aureimonas phyllosphaerae]MBB3935416.1 magnesium transporter [Aureimonas phyllosphaerae]MBB3959424.1 magnesium transporter [Aureimonas phyllosphaerae]SFF53141.1 magnesium transporter [Aureimonas phyllosphaerae]